MADAGAQLFAGDMLEEILEQFRPDHLNPAVPNRFAVIGHLHTVKNFHLADVRRHGVGVRVGHLAAVRA